MNAVLASVLLAALVAAPPPGTDAGPAPQILFDTTTVITHINLDAIPPRAIEDGWAAVVRDDSPEARHLLAELLAARAALVDLGGRSITSSISVRGREQGEMVAIRFADGANVPGLRRWIEAHNDWRMATAVDGNVLVGWRSGRRPDAAPSADVARRVSTALKAAGSSPVSLIYLPGESVREALSGDEADDADLPQPQRAAQAFRAAASASNWLAVTLAPGAKPQFSAVAELRTEDDAKALRKACLDAADAGDGLLHASNPRAGGDGDGSQSLSQLLTPELNGRRVVLTLDAGSMRYLSDALLPALLARRQAAKRAALAANMHQVLAAIDAYATQHDERFPPSLSDLASTGLLSPGLLAELMRHPAGRYSPAFIYKAPAASRRDIAAPKTTPLLVEVDASGEPLAEGKATIGYADGRVAAPSQSE